MHPIDWIVVAAYVIGMIGISIYIGRGQNDEHDYFVGGRNLPWWAVGISIVATQSSAISFVSIPAFVALRENGGLKWLQYELAVPLAMIFIMIFLVPYFRSLKLVSVFEFLKMRFGEGTAQFLSFIFLLSRGFGTGIGVYATALVLSAMLDMNVQWTILLIGVVAIVYDMIGGIKAVIFSDVIQLILVVMGAVLAFVYAIDLAGGLGNALEAFDVSRINALEPTLGIGEDASGAPFWAFLVGGFFLYASYYGTDQSQVQRALGTKDPEQAKRSLMLNGIMRLPLTLIYIALGIGLYAAYTSSSELRELIPHDKLDLLVPKFIVTYLPVGVKGLILAAILAAAMSSLDSALNSLSAVTMRDYIDKYLNVKPEQKINVSKFVTLIWGIVITICAFYAGDIDKTVIEAINKVGSAFYGPVLATFFLGVISRKASGPAMTVGVLFGVVFNMFLWIAKVPVHWMWWNLIGFVITALTAMILSGFIANRKIAADLPQLSISDRIAEIKAGKSVYLSLLVYFFFILGLVVSLHVAAS